MKSNTKTLTEGPLAKQILLVSLPLALSNLLQVLFNMSDVAVVGRFAGSTALGAVGSTSIFVTLFTGFLIGLSNGVNVLVARFYGARHPNDVHKTVHSALIVSIIAGVVLLLVGLLGSPALLRLLNTKEDLLPGAILYLRVYFLGMPALALFNFGNAIFSAIGETKKPLIYLSTAGVLNILLNLFFVIVCKLDVAGVAIATVISQCISASLVLRCMVKDTGPLHLDLKKMRLHPQAMRQILRIGLPAGFQGILFSLSNVVIQSAINSFGSTVVAGNSAASNLEGFIYTGMNAFAQAAVTFTSQNVGARRYDNLDRVMRNCLLCVTVVGLFLGCGAYFGGEVLLHFYSTDEAVVAAGLSRMQIICTAYFLCGIMDTLASCLRGRGYSVIPMIVSLVGSCLLRLVWIATIFRMFRSTGTLYISYPISWALTAGVHLICLLVVRKKMNDQLKEETRLAA